MVSAAFAFLPCDGEYIFAIAIDVESAFPGGVQTFPVFYVIFALLSDFLTPPIIPVEGTGTGIIGGYLPY